jgi:hypothetical protein
MFFPTHLLPRDVEEEEFTRRRWDDREGRRVHEVILQSIREGAGSDFVQRALDGEGGMLQDYSDLRGFRLTGRIVFPKRDTFKGIDFGYSRFPSADLTHGFFYSSFRFARFLRLSVRRVRFYAQLFLWDAAGKRDV